MALKKFLCPLCVLSIVFSIVIPTYAATPEKNSQYVESLDVSTSQLSDSMTIDELIAHSTILYADSEALSGHYDGDEDILVAQFGDIEALVPFPWTHTVEFDWTAKVNSSGDYIFDKITNANSFVEPGNHFLYFDVDSSELKDVYSFSRDRRTVTFSSSYELHWRSYNEPLVHEGIADRTRVIEMQELI